MTRELDEQCARAMGLPITDIHTRIQDAPANTYWTDRAIAAHDGYGAQIPEYSTDPAAARMLEDEIERRGMRRPYVRALWDIVGCDGNDEGENIWLDEWKLIRATAEQRARAFILATQSP